METAVWIEDVEDDEPSCFAEEDCVRELFRDAPPDCLFCALGDLGEEDDE
jgi:hypothetical protein